MRTKVRDRRNLAWDFHNKIWGTCSRRAWPSVDDASFWFAGGLVLVTNGGIFFNNFPDESMSGVLALGDHIGANGSRAGMILVTDARHKDISFF